MDLRIERHLQTKFAEDIASFASFADDTILRFVTGYRHVAKSADDYAQRLRETEKTFKAYIKWRRSGDMDNILTTTHLNTVPIGEYLRGSFVYGQNKYGHPLMWDQGLKLRKGADLSIHKDSDSTKDAVLAYIVRLLQEVKFATNTFYGLPTGIEAVQTQKKQTDDDDSKEQKENGSASREERTIGIYKHCLIFDL